MNWYYANAGRQQGPVSEEEFRQLIRSGTIGGDTLIWKEGMSDWLPYRELGWSSGPEDKPPPIQSEPGSTEGVQCNECGNWIAPEDVIHYGQRVVCAQCKPVFVQRLREGAPLSGMMDYGGFWIRFLAKILDGIILAVPMFLLGALIGTTAFSVDPQQTSFMVSITGNLLFYAIGAVYTIFFVGYFGATPGKMICRLKIVTAEGGSVSYLRATGRYFGEILSGVICYIGYLLAPFDDQKRTLHDHICNTRVIRIER